MILRLFKTIKRNLFWQNRSIRLVLLLNALINLFLWIFLYWQLKPTPEPIPLHYNIYFGIDQLGPWWHLFKLPLSGLGIFLINSVLSFIIYKHERLLSYFLLFVSLIIQGVLVWAGILILSL